MSVFEEDSEEETKWIVVLMDNSPSKIVKTGTLLQESPFCGDDKATMIPNMTYRIEPPCEWESLHRYTHCRASEELYGTGDYVFVQPVKVKSDEHCEAAEQEPTVHDYWIAKILEIKARDEDHVYARIYWMYWPDDLPKLKDCGETKSGRRDYHSKYELIASSHMEIISICTFAGVAVVSDWHTENDDELQPGLYWRQGFDYRAKKLSALKKYCTCEAYYNPDRVIVSCPNPDCGVWLHHECLADDILAKKCRSSNSSIEAMQGTIVKKRKRKGKGRPKEIPKKDHPYIGIYSAEIIDGEGDEAPQLEVTDLRVKVGHEMKKWKEDVLCPKCSTKIQ